MKLKYWINGVILMRCVFLAVPGVLVSPFLCAKPPMVTIYASSYAWAVGESITVLFITLLCYLFVSKRLQITKDRERVMGAYLLMCGLDLIDYLVRGNSEWFMLGSYPVTNNVLILAFFNFLTWSAEAE